MPTPDEGSHHLGHRARLRERFVRAGIQGLGEHEVVELLLTLAIPRSDVKQPAKELLRKFGSLRRILDAPAAEVQAVPGIGSVTPTALKIVRAVATLYLQQAAEEKVEAVTADELSTFWQMRIGSSPNEVFEVAYLDSGLRMLRNGVERLAEGTIDRAAVYPRRVVEQALKRGAAAVILAHNHPNGDVLPSEHDKVLTRAVSLASATVNLKVLDHLIVSPSESFSFQKAGLL